MIVGSHEWSEVQPIDWRQITSLSLALFISLPFFSTCFELIWCHGNASRKKTPRAAIGCTLSSVDTDVCLQKVGTSTQTRTICDSPKPAAPLPRLEWLLTRNLDPMMDKGFLFLGTRNLDKQPQNSEVAKMYNARHHMRNDVQASAPSESLNVWWYAFQNNGLISDVQTQLHVFFNISVFVSCNQYSLFPGCAYCVVYFFFIFFAESSNKNAKTPDKTQHTTNPKLWIFLKSL